MNMISTGEPIVAGSPLTFSTPLAAGSPEVPVEVLCFEALADIACLWKAFQQHAKATAYHSHEWADAWQATVGAKIGASPRILAGFARSGELLFILPLQIRRRFGLSVLEWHSSPDAPYGHGLFAADFLPHASDWFASNLSGVLTKAGAHDVQLLNDMPETMFGHPHPLRSVFNLSTPNETYMLQLAPDYDQVYSRKRNAETRRANRRKDNRLAESGTLQFRQITEPAETLAVVDVMLEHKTARLEAEGIHGVFNPEVCEMVRKLALAKSLFSLHALFHDDNVIACTFGGLRNGTYWFLISSIAPDGPLTKHSPGDLALRKTIESCCTAGLEGFDFGAGSANYKVGWTDDTIALYSCIRANSLVALPFAASQAAISTVKRLVKKNAKLKQLAFALRRLLKATRLRR